VILRLADLSQFGHWIKAVPGKNAYVEPDYTWEKGYSRIFNTRFCEHLLKDEKFNTLNDASVINEHWRRHAKTIHTQCPQMEPYAPRNYRLGGLNADDALTFTLSQSVGATKSD